MGPDTSANNSLKKASVLYRDTATGAKNQHRGEML